MTKQSFSLPALGLLLAIGLGPTPALAGGDHAGGHGHAAHQDSHHGAHDHAGISSAGRPGDPAKVTRSIELAMSDSMRFTPASITVRAGETVRLRVRNQGKVDHELVLGSRKDLQEHAELMRRFPGMEHEEPNMLRVAPGASGEIVWKFDQVGDVDFGCLIPGHFEAGMAGKVTVTQN